MAFLQDDAATGNGTAINLGGIGNPYTFYIEGAADVTAGVISIETARYIGYTGTWDVIETDAVSGGAVHTIVWNYPLKAVRARITTTVSGGADPGVTVEVLRTVPSA